MYNIDALLLVLAVGQPLPPQPEIYVPSDPLATREARQLMTRLGTIGSSPSFIFGKLNKKMYYSLQSWNSRERPL